MINTQQEARMYMQDWIKLKDIETSFSIPSISKTYTDEFKKQVREKIKRLDAYLDKLDNIEKDFIPRFKEYYGSEKMRTCPKCGHTMETDPRFG
jgi:rubrerythrin